VPPLPLQNVRTAAVGLHNVVHDNRVVSLRVDDHDVRIRPAVFCEQTSDCGDVDGDDAELLPFAVYFEVGQSFGGKKEGAPLWVPSSGAHLWCKELSRALSIADSGQLEVNAVHSDTPTQVS